MMTFRRRSFIESIKYKFIPSYRQQCDEETKAAIKRLCDHPEEPCVIGNHYVPNGYGGKSSTFEFLGF